MRTVDHTDTPDPTHSFDIVDVTSSATSSGDFSGYQNVGILFSPEGTTTINLHPLELFKSFTGTTLISGSVSYSDAPRAELPPNEGTGATISPYLSFAMDDVLDRPIVLPSQAIVLSTILNLNVVTTAAQDQRYLAAALTNTLSALVSGQAFLGGLANRVSGQQSYNTALVDALASGVGSLVDADMNEASTRLAALKAQQQLGLQALSIANDNAKLTLQLFGGG